MEIYELKEHCEQQISRLPKHSKMYDEHLLTLAIIDTNKKYFNEMDKLNKIIDLMAKAFKQDDVRSVEEIKQYFKELAERKSEEC